MRRKSNKNRGALLNIAALVFVIVLATVVWTNVFVVKNVVIHGSDDLQQAEIIRASQIGFGDLIHSVKPEEIKQNLESCGKYVLDGVLFRYPDTVMLNVRMRTRDAVVLNGGRYLVMDSDGYVIEALHVMPEDVGIYVYGLDATAFRIGSRITAQEDRLEAMKPVLDAIRENGAAEYLSDLDVTDVNRMIATSRTGIRIELGNADNMKQKAVWIRSAVSDLEARGEYRGTLDVSSGNKADYRP